MMDKTDKLILSELEKDSRQPIRSISEKTGLRPSTIHARMNRLIENKVITRFTIRTDDVKTGREFVVFMLINTDGKLPGKAFKDPAITEVFGVTGEYDLILKCKFNGIQEFNDFVLEFRNFSQVKKTLTMVGTIKIKEML